MQFRPLHDRVLVRRIEAEEKSAGGIIIPDNRNKSLDRCRRDCPYTRYRGQPQPGPSRSQWAGARLSISRMSRRDERQQSS
jgi:hypothetical protein